MLNYVVNGSSISLGFNGMVTSWFCATLAAYIGKLFN